MTAITQDTINGSEGHEAQSCPARKDGTHDYAWWDGDPCGSCGAPAMTDEEKRSQGMDAPARVLIWNVDDDPRRPNVPNTFLIVPKVDGFYQLKTGPAYEGHIGYQIGPFTEERAEWCVSMGFASWRTVKDGE